MLKRFRIARSPRSRWRGLVAVSASGLALGLATETFAQVTPVDKIVVFGDSISDGGSYADKAPPGAGSFTTNPDPVWVEVVAEGMGVDLKPHLTAGGTNYAEGGARVAAPRDNAPGNLSREPITRQVDDFLAHDGKLGPNSLVIVQGGGNDVFSALSNGPEYTPQDLFTLEQAANQLADQLVRLDAAGAGVLVTVSVPKFDVFNDYYDKAISQRGLNVLYVDIAGLIGEIEATPSAFGLVNTTDRACKGSALESFVCLPADYVTPDANRTYLYADSVHFTGVVHEIEGKAVLATLAAPAQISQLAQFAQSDAQAHKLRLDAQLHAEAPGPGRWAIFGGLSGDTIAMSAVRPDVDADTQGGHLGVEYGLQGFSVGAMLGLSRGDGDFGGQAGAFSSEIVTLTAFGRGRIGRIDAVFDATYGAIDFDDIRRRIVLGPHVRDETGQTSGHLVSIGAEFSSGQRFGGWRAGPIVGLRYDSVRLDGYAEAGDRSTQITFGGQELETLTASLGLSVRKVASDAMVRPFAQISYDTELLGHAPMISITPHGAPVSFTSRAYQADGDYLSYSLGAEATISPQATVIAGVGGVAARESLDAFAGFVSLRVKF